MYVCDCNCDLYCKDSCIRSVETILIRKHMNVNALLLHLESGLLMCSLSHLQGVTCISLSVLPAVCTIQCRHSKRCCLSVSARGLCDSMPALDTMPPLVAMPALHGAMMALGTIQCRRSVAAARFETGARCESMPALHSMPPLGACDAAARFGVTP
jgi:hypothetical protein